MRVDDIKHKLASLSNRLRSWNVDTFGSVCKEIKGLKRALERLRSDLARTGPGHEELKINERLVELYHREEILWRQHSRINWLKEGDRNTKNFIFERV